MANLGQNNRDNFGSKFGVIAAAAGSAVGLGNIWRFPYVAGENGGGAFLLIYLFFIVLIGLPVMLSEFTIGRRAQANPFGSFKKLAPGKPWYLVGLMGVVAAFVILAFYSTISGWTLEYIFKSASNAFAEKSPTELGAMFESFQVSTFRPVLWQVIFMILTAGIVVGGVKGGIEKYTKILMPMLVILILILCVNSISLPGAERGLKFLFQPDFSKINAGVVLQALGQAAFSLSIGMGTLITYGSYIQKNNNLTKTAIQVSTADTLIAILAGVMIFPAVFAFGINPAEGPDLVFKVLPSIFQQMQGGYVFGLVFFILLTIAALTSSVSVLEVVVAYFAEEFKMSRKKATAIATVAITAIGVICTLSFGELNEIKILKQSIFDAMVYLAANLLLPLGALLIVVFLGWQMGKKKVLDEISNEGALKTRMINVFMFIVKFIAPLAIAAVFLYELGLIKLGE